MRIISFSNASTQPFWTVPVQALAPWMTRIQNSLIQIPVLSTTQRVVDTLQQPFAPDAITTSGHSAFAMGPEVLVLPCKTVSKSLPRSSLRVVRESDSALGPDCAGRMVISGRMADVCAELDRMALRATATH